MVSTFLKANYFLKMYKNCHLDAAFSFAHVAHFNLHFTVLLHFTNVQDERLTVFVTTETHRFYSSLILILQLFFFFSVQQHRKPETDKCSIPTQQTLLVWNVMTNWLTKNKKIKTSQLLFQLCQKRSWSTSHCLRCSCFLIVVSLCNTNIWNNVCLYCTSVFI